jgi:hypothetical protein
MSKLASFLPLLLLAACAESQSLPPPDQPELARLAQLYAQQLREVGITKMISPGTGDMVRLETGYGPVYVRYPANLPQTAFVLEVGRDQVRAAATKFDEADDAQVLAALVPEAVRVTVANNRMEWLRANPWN